MTSLAILRLRNEARDLHRLGDRLFEESEELLKRSCAAKAAARALEERADELEDEADVGRLAGSPVSINRGRKAA